MPLIPSTMNPSTSGGGSTGNQTDSWMNLLAGKKLGDKHDATNFDRKELPSKHRVIDESTGGMRTMDFDQDRLNIHVDKDGTVSKVTHG